MFLTHISCTKWHAWLVHDSAGLILAYKEEHIMNSLPWLLNQPVNQILLLLKNEFYFCLIFHFSKIVGFRLNENLLYKFKYPIHIKWNIWNIWYSGFRFSGKFECGNDSMKVARKRNVILPQSPMFWDPTSDRSYQFSEWLQFSLRYSKIINTPKWTGWFIEKC